MIDRQDYIQFTAKNEELHILFDKVMQMPDTQIVHHKNLAYFDRTIENETYRFCRLSNEDGYWYEIYKKTT